MLLVGGEHAEEFGAGDMCFLCDVRPLNPHLLYAIHHERTSQNQRAAPWLANSGSLRRARFMHKCHEMMILWNQIMPQAVSQIQDLLQGEATSVSPVQDLSGAGSTALLMVGPSNSVILHFQSGGVPPPHSFLGRRPSCSREPSPGRSVSSEEVLSMMVLLLYDILIHLCWFLVIKSHLSEVCGGGF